MKRPGWAVSVKTDTAQIKKRKQTGKEGRRGDVGRRQDDPAPRRVPKASTSERTEAKHKHAIFNCLRAVHVIVGCRTIFSPDLITNMFLNVQPSWNHFTAKLHTSTTCILLLALYYTCWSSDLSICPSAYPSINPFDFLVHLDSHLDIAAIPLTRVRMHGINSKSMYFYGAAPWYEYVTAIKQLK